MKSEGKKKESKKGGKKGCCEHSGFQLSFSALFRSLSPFHAVWVLLKGGILKWSKRIWVNFSGFYSSLSYVIC
jgi:hypothetical protein